MALSPPPARDNYPVQNGFGIIPRQWLKWFTDLGTQSNHTATKAKNNEVLIWMK